MYRKNKHQNKTVPITVILKRTVYAQQLAYRG